MPTPRKIAGYGWRRQLPDHRDYQYEPPTGLTVPAKASLRPYFEQHIPVYDQSQLGSCTAQGAGAAWEYLSVKEFNQSVTPSRLFIYYNERVIEGTVSSDAGAEVRDALKTLAQQGAPPETDWPYDINRFADQPPQQAYTDAVKHEAVQYKSVRPDGSIRKAVASGYPVVFGFSVPDYFETDNFAKPGYVRLPDPTTQIIGGHCVLVVGYDFTKTIFPVNVVECRNSWGPNWGDGGYFYMDARWFNDPNLTADFWVLQRIS